jgi:hypothetical protein
VALSSIAEGLDAAAIWSYLEHLLYDLHYLWIQKDAAEKRAFGRLIFRVGQNCSKSDRGTPLAANFLTTYGQKDELIALTTTKNTLYVAHSKTHMILNVETLPRCCRQLMKKFGSDFF